MNLSQTIELNMPTPCRIGIHAGGPGSGCQGENCGRPPGSGNGEHKSTGTSFGGKALKPKATKFGTLTPEVKDNTVVLKIGDKRFGTIREDVFSKGRFKVSPDESTLLDISYSIAEKFSGDRAGAMEDSFHQISYEGRSAKDPAAALSRFASAMDKFHETLQSGKRQPRLSKD